ncbi:MAG: bifunctional hydroxymethylpyrimidine kinase/phosphomethylpyrimidine kinase [Planctomycetaceae bacterium]|nr:bifunctional hydroxymethylpyrimidine kinase/phosphomethylpyrimidine kinase [Planctomycetaceae bacterium]
MTKKNSRKPKLEFTLARTAVALTIAGSDPSGGAGLQADLKTFQQMGVYGMSVVTLLTVQNTQRVERVVPLEPELVVQQLRAVLADIRPRAIKLGALGNAAIIRSVAQELAAVNVPVVIDPVMVSKHGHSLIDDAAIESYRRDLFPNSLLITPNRLEAEKLTGMSIRTFPDVQLAIHRLQQMGCRQVLLKFGRIDDTYSVYLSHKNGIVRLATPYQKSNSTHGSGCVLAAYITGLLALGATDLTEVAEHSLVETTKAVSVAAPLGRGIFPAETRVMHNPLSEASAATD